MTRRTSRIAIAAAVAALLAATACGDSDSASPTSVANGSQVSGADTAVAHNDEITVERFQYLPADESDPEENWADLYLPAGPQAVDTIPLVVLIHGGSWKSELGADLFDPLARQLAGRGVAVFNVEYRRVGSGGGWPTTFRDVARALDYVVEVDAKYPQLTTDDELVAGHSAGAQLAVWAGTRHKLEDDEVGAKPAFRPTRVVSLAGPLDMVWSAEHGNDRIVRVLGGTPKQVPERYTSVDPVQNIDPDTPVIAMHGTKDELVDPANSRRYVDAVNREGGSARLVMLQGETHGSFLGPDSPSYERVMTTITDTSAVELEELQSQ